MVTLTRRHTADIPLPERTHYVYARCTATEYELIEKLAAKEHLTVSDFVRRCVNGYLLDQGDDVLLLREYGYTRHHR